MKTAGIHQGGTLWLASILLPGLQPGAGHSFAEAAFLEKSLLQSAKLLVEKVVGLVEEADEDIRNDLRWPRFDVGPHSSAFWLIAKPAQARYIPPRMSEIPKAYEPRAVESKWYDFWLDQKCFVANPASPKPAYSIVIPPPNVTGVLTLGHVLNNTIQDILARKARMDGKEVLWLPGTDHAGIATQTVVERTLKKQGEIKHRNDLGREKLLEKVWEWKEKHGGIIIQQLKKLGASCDWTRERFTMDPEYSRCVQKVFVDLYKKGLIYRGKRMVNWCPVSLTALSDEEVTMKEQRGSLYYFKVEVAEEPGTFLSIATTRPETIPGDTAVAVNPKDPRYAHLIGKHIVRPLPPELPREKKLIPIVGDDHIDIEFGTGVLKVTPAHDKADFEIGMRHNLPPVEVIAADGHMNELAGADLNGLDRFKARKIAAEKLAELGALEKEEPYTNNVGFSERADVPIEPRLSEQWFLKYPSVDKSQSCVANGGMKFHPDRWAKVYDHWMTGIQDWCISRQLWWGHRIPVWYNQEARDKLGVAIPIIELSGGELDGASIKELRDTAWKFAESHHFLNRTFHNSETGWEILVRPASLEHAFSHHGPANIKAIVALPELIRTARKLGSLRHIPPNEHFKSVHLFVAAARIGQELYQVKITVKEHLNGQKLYDHQLIKIRTPDGESPAPPAVSSEPTRPTSGAEILISHLFADVNRDTTFIRCELDAPGDAWTQDPDVLDTWFSSWLWPFATMGWTGDPEADSKNETLKKFYPTTDLVTGPDIIFFWVARMIMAGHEFMGEMPFRNVYFTGIIRDKQGRKMSKSLGNSPDPLDLIAKYGADALRFGVMRAAPLGQDILFDEQNVELGRNFCNKLWNACRFRQMQGGESEDEIRPELLTSDDKWILLRLDTAIRELTESFTEYRFNEATQTLYRFFWSEFCDWYLEASKAVFFAEDPARKANTLAVIDFVLSNTLRLFHPFLPFISEELWHGLGYNHELPAGQGSETIMFACWPKPLGDDFKTHYGLDESDLRFVDAKYELITKGRNLRREGNIPSSKKVAFVFKPPGQVSTHEAEVMRILLNAESLSVEPNYQPRKGTPAALSPLGELYLPLEGLIDVEAERARLAKELGKVEIEIEKVVQKLNNQAFVEKVPPQVLEEHKKRLVDWQAKKQQITSALENLA
jgi:valyl-tRNA synthetase